MILGELCTIVLANTVVVFHLPIGQPRTVVIEYNMTDSTELSLLGIKLQVYVS